MFGKQVGHYHLSTLKNYLFPKKKEVNALKSLLPKRKQYYFFSDARYAIYHLIKLIQKEKKKEFIKIVYPAWSCSILQDLLKATKGELVPFEVNPNTLKMDVNSILVSKAEIVILVAENGILYSKEEIIKLKNAGCTVIGDYSLALRKVNKITNDCDYDVYSGGFSKPISSFGLGIIGCDQELPFKEEFTKNFNLFALFKAVIHLFIQNERTYILLKKLIGEPGIEVFELEKETLPNFRSISALSNELGIYKSNLLKWDSFYLRLSKILGKGIEPVKVVIEKEKILSDNGIHFHQQYKWALKEKNTNEFQNFRSFSINYCTLYNSEKFFKILNKNIAT